MKNGPLKYWLKKIFYYPAARIKRFLDYAPLIWRDEDFDHSYILHMLKYKIERTRKHIDEHKFFIGYKERVKEMLEAEQIIDRILGDKYMEAEHEAHSKKYPTQWKEDEKGESFLESTHNKPEGKEFRKIYKEHMRLKKADLRRLGDLISNNIEGWWD